MKKCDWPVGRAQRLTKHLPKRTSCPKMKQKCSRQQRFMENKSQKQQQGNESSIKINQASETGASQMLFSFVPINILTLADSLNLRSAAEERVFINQITSGATLTLFGITATTSCDTFSILQITTKSALYYHSDLITLELSAPSNTVASPADPPRCPLRPPPSRLSVHLVTQRSPSPPGRDHMTPPPPSHLLRPAAAALAQQKQHRLLRPWCDFGRHSRASPHRQGHVTHFGM